MATMLPTIFDAAFFRKQEAARAAALAERSGLSGDAALDEMIRLGVDAESFPAFALVPLVALAWADGRLSHREREAILVAVEAEGIRPGGAAARLLEDWLSERPPRRLFDAWERYARAVGEDEAVRRSALAAAVLGRARAVVETARRFRSRGRLSRGERRALERIVRAVGAAA